MEAQAQTLSNHIVILGWSERVQRIIAQLRNEDNFDTAQIEPILVVAPSVSLISECEYARVYFTYGSISDVNTLTRARISRAKVVIIPVDTNLAPETGDGQNILALLSTLALSTSTRICIEVSQASHGIVLEQIRRAQILSNSVEIISYEALSERLLAQAAVNAGVTRVYDHLLSFDETNEIYVYPLSQKWHGHSFRELHSHCFEHDVLLIGYQRQNSPLDLNPRNRDYAFGPGDVVWCIALDKKAVATAID